MTINIFVAQQHCTTLHCITTQYSTIQHTAVRDRAVPCATVRCRELRRFGSSRTAVTRSSCDGSPVCTPTFTRSWLLSAPSHPSLPLLWMFFPQCAHRLSRARGSSLPPHTRRCPFSGCSSLNLGSPSSKLINSSFRHVLSFRSCTSVLRCQCFAHSFLFSSHLANGVASVPSEGGRRLHTNTAFGHPLGFQLKGPLKLQRWGFHTGVWVFWV